MGFGEEDPKGEVSFSSYHVKGTCCQHDLSLMTLTLITWLRFPVVNLFFSPSPYCGLWKTSPKSRGKELNSTSLRWSLYINYLEFYMGDFSLSPIYLSIQSFISVQTQGYLFYALGYNPVLLY